MNPTNEQELRELCLRCDVSNYRTRSPIGENDFVQLITADRKRVALEARIDPFNFVDPCEPDCDDVRHAYHQGQWDMANRIEAQQEEV